MTDEEALEQAEYNWMREPESTQSQCFGDGFRAGLAHARGQQAERITDDSPVGQLMLAAEQARQELHCIVLGLPTHSDERLRQIERELFKALRALDHPAPIEPEPEPKCHTCGGRPHAVFDEAEYGCRPEPERKGDEVVSATRFTVAIAKAGYMAASRQLSEVVCGMIEQRDAAIRRAAIRECAEVLRVKERENLEAIRSLRNKSIELRAAGKAWDITMQAEHMANCRREAFKDAAELVLALTAPASEKIR